jgi:hypothetical protein
MKQRELIETVQQHHPTMGEVEIRKLLNRASDDYCAKTELIKNTYKQNTTAGQRYYKIHDDILKIVELHIDDVIIPRMIGKPIIDDDEIASTNTLATPTTANNERYWYIDHGRIGVIEKTTNAITRDDKTSDYQSIAEALEMRIYAVSKAPHLSELNNNDDGNSYDIPTQFHEGVAYRVIGLSYLVPANFNAEASATFLSMYNQTIKDGKKFARNQYRTTGYVAPQDF